jgi:ubiquinone/menaquinone biosynthesis C-methylase UbiE
MRFYRDIISDVEGALENSKYQYHNWSPQSISVYWDTWTHNPFLRNQFYPIEYWQDLLLWANQRIATPPLRVLDIGCGDGNLIACIRKVYKEAWIWGVDISAQSMEPAKERFHKDEKIRFKVGSVERLPFEDDSIDLVTCTEVLEHAFPNAFLHSFSEIRRVLTRRGHYLASMPFNEEISFVCCPECGSVFTPYQHMLFQISHQEIRELLSKNGLTVVEFYTSLDRSQPAQFIKRALKPIIIRWLPGFAKRIFPQAGVSGFLATRSS